MVENRMGYVIHLMQIDDLRLAGSSWKKNAALFKDQAGLISARLYNVSNLETVDFGGYNTATYQQVGIYCWRDITSLRKAAPLFETFKARLDGLTHIDEVICKSHSCFGMLNASNEKNIMFITACQISDDQADSFLNQFNRAKAYMKMCKGFVGFNLLQSMPPYKKFSFVNIAQWETISDFIAAFSAPEFKSIIGQQRGGHKAKSIILPLKAVD